MWGGRVLAYVGEVLAELRRIFRPPWTDISPVALNALIVCVGWWVLPLSLKEWLFENLNGKLAFVLVLQTYMLCDINSTNQLGNFPAGAIEALRTGTVAERIRVQITAMAVLIGVVCAPLAIGITVVTGGWERAVYLLPMLMATAFAAPSVSCLVGVLIPLRERSWLWRWRYRIKLHEHVRWILLGFVLPYPIVSSITGAYLWLCKRGADRITGFSPSSGEPPPPTTVGWFSGLAVLLAIVVWWIGPIAAAWVAQLNRRHLLSYLATASEPPSEG